MTAQLQLQNLQLEQIDHDRMFHPDILCLPVQRRACHMALHFAKYAGKFAEAKQAQDRDLMVATLIDTFIIVLATSNIFNKRVSEFSCIVDFSGQKDLNDIAKKISPFRDVSQEGVYCYISDAVSIESGKMAKAIESLDHLEDYDYVGAILGALNKILEACLVTAFFVNTNLQTEVQGRLVAVEKKSIFYSSYRGGTFPAQSDHDN